ncbi:MAG TPA: STAS domain-containing protein [Acidimicrobiales bacterium]|nr:STAS domain-containing protein [Acidimicrobiales bacterium]
MTVTDVSDVPVCRVEGSLDGMTVSHFRQAYAGCLERPALVLDLSDLVFIDSAGLSALVGGIRRARELSVEVVVACTRAPLRKVLEHVGLNLIVSVSERTDDALARVCSAPALRRPSGSISNT